MGAQEVPFPGVTLAGHCHKCGAWQKLEKRPFWFSLFQTSPLKGGPAMPDARLCSAVIGAEQLWVILSQSGVAAGPHHTHTSCSPPDTRVGHGRDHAGSVCALVLLPPPQLPSRCTALTGHPAGDVLYPDASSGPGPPWPQGDSSCCRRQPTGTASALWGKDQRAESQGWLVGNKVGRKTGLELKEKREKSQEKSQDMACSNPGAGSLPSLSASDTWEPSRVPAGLLSKHREGRRCEFGGTQQE